MTSPYADWTRDQKIVQAKDWRSNGWSLEALADEFDVSKTTIQYWIDEKFRLRHIKSSAKYTASLKTNVKRRK